MEVLKSRRSSSRLALVPQVLPAAVALLLFAAISARTPSTELYDLVYSGCANRTFPTGDLPTYLQTLDTLTSALLAKAVAATFYQTDQPLLHGLFQCRGDLSADGCAACVRRIPEMWKSLCGDSVAARVQLIGCYALYEVAGFPQVSGAEVLYKECGGGSSATGWEEKRKAAFASLLAGGRGSGFYDARDGNLEAEAQCEEDLSAGDCAECVMEAAQKVQAECGGMSYGRMYLEKCYLSYGSPVDGGGGGGGGGASGHKTVKTVAIVIGAAAAVGFLVVCLLFMRSLYKKEHN